MQTSRPEGAVVARQKPGSAGPSSQDAVGQHALHGNGRGRDGMRARHAARTAPFLLYLATVCGALQWLARTRILEAQPTPRGPLPLTTDEGPSPARFRDPARRSEQATPADEPPEVAEETPLGSPALAEKTRHVAIELPLRLVRLLRDRPTARRHELAK